MTTRKEPKNDQKSGDVASAHGGKSADAVTRRSPTGGLPAEAWRRLRKARLWIALVVIALALVWGGFRIGDRQGLVIGFFLAVALNALVIFYDDWRLAARFEGLELEGSDPWGILRMTRELSRKLGVKMPVIREVESATPFVLSCGLFPSRLKLFISTGLTRKFSQDECRALIARELIRAQEGQTRTATAASAFADLWLLAMGALDAALLLRFIIRRPLKRWRLGPFTWMSLPFVAFFLRLVIGRRSGLDVDRRTAELGGELSADMRALAGALVKLDSFSKTMPLDVNVAEAALFAVDPLASHDWSIWTSVHPMVDERVRTLTGQFPL